MEKEKAVKIILSMPHLRNRLKVLTAWDETLTLGDNADALFNGNWRSARQFAYKFKLGFFRVGRHRAMRWVRKYDYSKWDASKTLAENAKILGCTKEYARYVCRRERLSYLKRTKRTQRIYTPQYFTGIGSMRERIDALRKTGVTLAGIGKILGVSRQAVEQVCSKRERFDHAYKN